MILAVAGALIPTKPTKLISKLFQKNAYLYTWTYREPICNSLKYRYSIFTQVFPLFTKHWYIYRLTYFVNTRKAMLAIAHR